MAKPIDEPACPRYFIISERTWAHMDPTPPRAPGKKIVLTHTDEHGIKHYGKAPSSPKSSSKKGKQQPPPA